MRRLPFRPALLCLPTLMLASGTQAATSIDTALTTPIVTSGVAGGSADDIAIASSGSVKPSSGAAVTLDSDNSVSNAGTILIQDVNDATGIAVQGGRTGSVTNTGTIEIDETTAATDADGDGDNDGKFATGARRYGVRVSGGAPFTGSIANSGSISVEGDDSGGISVETGLVGSITQSGSVSITGDRSYGVRTIGSVSGDVTLTGSVTAVGAGATAVSLEGDIGGGLVIQNSITATGYRTTTRSTTQSVLNALDADDLLQGGSALSVSGSVARGLLIDVPPTDTDSTNTDEDGDGITDTSEGSGLIVSYGAAPAVVIGAADRAIVFGDVGTGASGYGLFNRGTISGVGVYDGVSATGLQIGLVGGGSVTIGSGLSNAGSILASAYKADATGLLLNSGALVPQIANSGSLTASVIGDTPATATALLMQSGARASGLTNTGTISAAVNGEAGDAVAIRDGSGTLASIVNTGKIAATITATDDAADTDDADTDATNEKVTGRTIALDLSANTSGVTIRQSGVNDGDDGADGAADADADGDGVDDADEPAITGEVLLGSGADRIELLNGTLTGDVSFGAGANSLLIDGGASMAGRLTATGGTLALSVQSGSLAIDNVGVLNLTSLSLGAKSTTTFTIDPASGAATVFDVAGAADIAGGATLGVRLTSLLKDQATYTIIRANSLSAGAAQATLLGDVPYLYSAAIEADTAAGTVDIHLGRKSATDLALAAAVAQAYEPMIAAIDTDTEVRDAVLAQVDRAGFIGLYNQMLPNHSDAVFQVTGANTDAFARAIDDRQGPDAGGLWVQEIGSRLKRDGSDDAPGYKAWSLGLIAGLESPDTALGIVGVTLGGASGKIDPDGAANGSSFVVNTVEAGGYWRISRGAFSANARAAGGWVGLKSTRAIAAADVDGNKVLSRTAKADWSGAVLNGRLAAGYEARLGPAYLKPTASLDYLWLREGGYEESGGGDAIDLIVKSRTSARASGFAGVVTGVRFGREAWWGPELQLGWRNVTGKGAGDTTARFAAGGDSFRLLADQVTGGGFVVRGAVKGDQDGTAFVLEGGAEMRDDLAVYDVRLAAHVRF